MGQELGEPSPSTSIVRQLEVRYESALLHPPTLPSPRSRRAVLQEAHCLVFA